MPLQPQSVPAVMAKEKSRMLRTEFGEKTLYFFVISNSITIENTNIKCRLSKPRLQSKQLVRCIFFKRKKYVLYF